MNPISEELFQYAVSIRRQLHRHPEIGFELDETVSLVAGELEKMGIEYTGRYGKSSIVGFIGHDPNKRTLAIRADMDALPLQEKSGVPFSSEYDGKMHACGHDSHTACLLAAASVIKANERNLKCNIRLIFQPSEEGEISGAKMLVDNGVMDGVDAIIAQHNETLVPVGHYAIKAGDCLAACIPATLRFYGKTAHATLASTGVDAIAMAVESYYKLKDAVKEEAQGRKYIWSVGTFHSGTVHNVISDYSEQKISFRYYDQEFADRVAVRVNKICTEIAEKYGGRYELDFLPSAKAVINDDFLAKALAEELAKYAPVDEDASEMGSEDFCWYLTKAPGVFYRFGNRDESVHPMTRPHNNDFYLHEEGLRIAIQGLIGAAFFYQ